jgi:hypothetical protein
MLSRLKFSVDSNFDQQALDSFLADLSVKYGKYNNPFHNFSHGVNGNLFLNQVMHLCYDLAKLEKNKDYLSDINVFSLVFSGLCHDVGHPGRTNPF